MKKVWYYFMKFFLGTGLFFYFKKIKVVGTENIPKKGAILFVGNHRNALIDPLLIATTNNRNTHFLTRAGVFKKKLIIAFFNSVQMIPIYRIRDGWTELAKNQAIFEKCISILKKQKALLIFPEGSHSILRKVRPLSKGFTRIVFGAFEKHPDLQIHIVPVGLNFDYTTKYPSSASIYYGKPILANDYWDSNTINTSMNELKKEVHDGMKILTTHIDKNDEEYDEILAKLDALNVDYLNPKETNKIIQNIDNQQLKSTTKKFQPNKNIFYYLMIFNGLIPWLIWKKMKKGINEIEFTSSIRYGIGITLFPIFYALQAILISLFLGKKIGLIYFICSILIGLLASKTPKSHH